MKHTIEGIGKIEVVDGVLFINDQPLSSVLEDCDISNLKLCGSIRIEICGRKPEITVRKGKQS